MNEKTKEICDGIILSAAEEIIAVDQSNPFINEQLGAIMELQNKCHAFADEGFTSSLIVPICQKKADFIKRAKTKTELKAILETPKVRYNGNEVVPDGKYHVVEEEALIWSMTSLKAPLNQAGFDRYMKVFREIFPDMANIVDPQHIYESKNIELTAEESDTSGAELLDGEHIDYDNANESDMSSDDEDDCAPEIDNKTGEETQKSEIYNNAEPELTQIETVVPVVKTLEPIENAVEKAAVKLEKEANTSGGQQVPAIPIYNYLKKLCAADEPFAMLVLQEHKTLLKCFTYIYEQVKKTVADKTGTQCVWVSDDATYKLAEDYYRLDDAEIERKREEEKKKQQEESDKRRAETAKRNAERKNSAGTQQSGNDLAITAAKKPAQMSLFDEEGEHPFEGESA